jgi:hypothetical protein
MNTERESLLKFYSIGIVVKNKIRGSSLISVYPVEVLPGIKGSIADAGGTSKITVTNATGSTVGNSATSQSTLTAKWIPINNSNRTSPPDVYVNESVMIYRYADTDKYYWNTMYGEPSLRKLEDVTYSFSNVKDPNATFDPTTSYWIRYNTFDKFIQLHTSTNDGEKAGYDIIIDTGNGEISVIDTLGNSIILNSVAGDLNATTTKSIETNTETTTINSSTQVTVNSPEVTINANNSTTINTNTAIINAPESVELNTPLASISGNLNVGEGISFGTTMTGGGMSVSNGTVTATTFVGNLNGNANSATYIG